MITTETLAKLQVLGIRLDLIPTITKDGPAIDVTLSHGVRGSFCQWHGRAMSPELVDRCIHRGLPTLLERIERFRAKPEQVTA